MEQMTVQKKKVFHRCEKWENRVTFCDFFLTNLQFSKKKTIKNNSISFRLIVSFQDDDSLCDDDPVIDLPSVLRRASLVPLAAKIRLNRPPTAPPGSIFSKSIAIR